MVTSVSGENICEESVCLPNPCQNGGACQLSDDATGGYECSCRDGYTGNDCSEDVNECLDSKCMDTIVKTFYPLNNTINNRDYACM